MQCAVLCSCKGTECGIHSLPAVRVQLYCEGDCRQKKMSVSCLLAECLFDSHFFFLLCLSVPLITQQPDSREKIEGKNVRDRKRSSSVRIVPHLPHLGGWRAAVVCCCRPVVLQVLPYLALLPPAAYLTLSALYLLLLTWSLRLYCRRLHLAPCRPGLPRAMEYIRVLLPQARHLPRPTLPQIS